VRQVTLNSHSHPLVHSPLPLCSQAGICYSGMTITPYYDSLLVKYTPPPPFTAPPLYFLPPPRFVHSPSHYIHTHSPLFTGWHRLFRDDHHPVLRLPPREVHCPWRHMGGSQPPNVSLAKHVVPYFESCSLPFAVYYKRIHYDSLLAKYTARGATWEEVNRRM
jgi:hypothetical protein